MQSPLLSIPLEQPDAIVTARQHARGLAALVGLDASSQTRFAASVSEIARNAVSYGTGGQITFLIERKPRPALIARVTDRGCGIPDLDAVVEGRTVGNGIAAARRLVDDFTITSDSRGTTVCLTRRLPDGVALGEADIARIIAALPRDPTPNPTAEAQTQNAELITSLAELQVRQEELQRLNTELEDTNRGVVALYAELDERAEQLRQASELKSRFLSNMSHEFRTPLNSILALSRLLLDGTDGPLTVEQERQVSYILRSADSLTELVNDLLDLAKVEAGKLEVRPALFTVAELFGALRGVMKPLRQNDAVELVFEEPTDTLALFTDEAKVAQVLRNLISNALKFTERGEVRVSASIERVRGSDGICAARTFAQAGGANQCSLTVTDTGIGIAPENHEVVFQEFSQVANQLQFRAKGTGLGLPLSRRLAELLGGTLTLQSEPGVGSTFTLCIPVTFRAAGSPAPLVAGEPDAARSVLLIDDEETSRYVLRQMLAGGIDLHVMEADTGAEGLRRASIEKPDVIILDLHLPDLNGLEVMDRLAEGPETQDIPVVICTSSILGTAERNRLARARTILSKATLTRELMQNALAGVWPDEASAALQRLADLRELPA